MEFSDLTRLALLDRVYLIGKTSNLSAFIVNLIDLFDGIEVIHAGIDSDLIQHNDASFLRCGI